MPMVAAASPLRPIATRMPLIAITAAHALCKTIKAKLVTLTSHTLFFAGCCSGEVVKSRAFFVGEPSLYSSYRRTEFMSSDATLSKAKTHLMQNRLSGLLFGEVADKGKLVAFAFARFHDHKDPDNQKSRGLPAASGAIRR